MSANGWNTAFGELARATMSSPELERYYSIPITKPRAQLILKQLSLYVRHRRDCWAYVSGNCPVLAVKQKILAHASTSTTATIRIRRSCGNGRWPPRMWRGLSKA